MATRRKRSRTGHGDLPRGVVRSGNGYRAWAMFDGKRVYSRTFETVAEAAAMAKSMRADSKRAAMLPLEQTFGDAFELMLAEAEDETERHYKSHRDVIELHLPADLPLHAVRSVHVERLRDAGLEAGLKASTIRRRLSAVRKALNLAIRRGWREPPNPASELEMRWPKEKRGQVDYFTEAEIRSVIERMENASPRYRCRRRHAYWVAVLAMTGLRRREFERSVPAHWDVEACTVFVDGKNGERVVPWATELRPIVQWLIADGRGSIGPTARGSINGILRDWKSRLGEPRLHPHALRHTYGTALVRRGHDVYTIAQLMGHASIKTTELYFHVCGVMTRNAAASLRLLPPSLETPDAGAS